MTGLLTNLLIFIFVESLYKIVNRIKKFVHYTRILFLVFVFHQNTSAQFILKPYFDIGETAVSQGPYLRLAPQLGYKLDSTTFEVGALFDIVGNRKNVFTGIQVNIKQCVPIKKFTLNLQGFFKFNTASKTIHETNLGFLIGTYSKHFEINLGLGFRTYHITQEAKKLYGIYSNLDLNESWNILYDLKYYVKPRQHKWNVGLAVTNMDYFLMNQETNPYAYLFGKYSITNQLSMRQEFWLKSAGFLNVRVGYFGYVLRTMLIWEFKKK